MRYFNRRNDELFEEDIDLKWGKLSVETIIKPEATPPDGINKLDWEDDDYEEVYIYEPIENPNQHEINLLKQRLANTDYIVMKIVEGVASLSDYAELLKNRKAWRAEINALEDAVVSTEE